MIVALLVAASIGVLLPDFDDEPAVAFTEPVHQEMAEDETPQKKVVPIRGAKLANSDKNPANPFSVEHLTEAQERERGLLNEGRGKSGIIGTDPTKANNSEAIGKASAGKKNSSGQGREQVVDDVSPAENIKLIGVLVSDDKGMAIIGVGNKQVSLAVGEEDGGVVLLSMDGNSAVVKDSCGQIHNLYL